MGGSKKYDPGVGIKTQTYKQIGITSTGVKIVTKIEGTSENTPLYSNTPYTQYAALEGKTRKLKQISTYSGGVDGREKIKDVEMGHEHTNKKNGLHFGINDLHTQVYKNGIRDSEARKPSSKEKREFYMALYGRS